MIPPLPALVRVNAVHAQLDKLTWHLVLVTKYYRLIEQIGACMKAKAKAVPTDLMLRWDDEKAETFSLVDDVFYSASDQRSLSLCGVLGAVGHILCDLTPRR